MERPKVNENIAKSAKYVPGKPLDEFIKVNKAGRIIKLDANENPFGFSDKIFPALKKKKLNRYPDGGCGSLREFLAQGLKLKPDNFLITPGSNQIIDYVCRAYLEQGNSVVTGENTFSLYKILAKKNGGKLIEVPLTDKGEFNLDEMAKRVSKVTDIVFICNPNNPTGTALDRDYLVDFIKFIPSNVLIVVDEAYIEFCEEYSTVIDVINDFPNVLVMRTFSKMYGLAGFRIGYAASNAQLISELSKVMIPFSVSQIALTAAETALHDTDFVENTYRNNYVERKRVLAYFAKKNWNYFESQTNFIFVKIPIPNVKKKLENKGILIRGLSSFGFGDDAFRVSIGTQDENSALIEALETFQM